ILARDEEAAKVAPAGFVVYTEAEVALLLTATPDELRQVHEAKRRFGGRVVDRKETGPEGWPGMGAGVKCARRKLRGSSVTQNSVRHLRHMTENRTTSGFEPSVSSVSPNNVRHFPAPSVSTNSVAHLSHMAK